MTATYTYTATAPDGTTHTRSSNRTYTHAVLVLGHAWHNDVRDAEPTWGAWGFSGSAANAAKMAQQAGKSSALRVEVVPVEVVEHTPSRVTTFKADRREAVVAAATAAGWVTADEHDSDTRVGFERDGIKVYVHFAKTGAITTASMEDHTQGKRNWRGVGYVSNHSHSGQAAKLAAILEWFGPAIEAPTAEATLEAMVEAERPAIEVAQVADVCDECLPYAVQCATENFQEARFDPFAEGACSLFAPRGTVTWDTATPASNWRDVEVMLYNVAADYLRTGTVTCPHAEEAAAIEVEAGAPASARQHAVRTFALGDSAARITFASGRVARMITITWAPQPSGQPVVWVECRLLTKAGSEPKRPGAGYELFRLDDLARRSPIAAEYVRQIISEVRNRDHAAALDECPVDIWYGASQALGRAVVRFDRLAQNNGWHVSRRGNTLQYMRADVRVAVDLTNLGEVHRADTWGREGSDITHAQGDLSDLEAQALAWLTAPADGPASEPQAPATGLLTGLPAINASTGEVGRLARTNRGTYRVDTTTNQKGATVTADDTTTPAPSPADVLAWQNDLANLDDVLKAAGYRTWRDQSDTGLPYLNVWADPADRYPAHTVYRDNDGYTWGGNFEHNQPHDTHLLRLAVAIVDTLGN